MCDPKTVAQNLFGWNTISERYQEKTEISTNDVHYGPLAPGEKELGLLGCVQGQRVLEIGCGGGQNSIALTRWGATCVGLDPSQAQLAYARALAVRCNTQVQFVQGVAEQLTMTDESFDLALSSYAFDYVGDLEAAYKEAWRVLVPGGTFVFCLSHPWFSAVGWYLAGDPDVREIGNYAAWPIADEWDWTFDEKTTGRMRSYQRKLQDLVNQLLQAGFSLERLIEQHISDMTSASPGETTDPLPYICGYNPLSQEYTIMRQLPRTLIICARKRLLA